MGVGGKSMITKTTDWTAEEMAAGCDFLAIAFLYGPMRLDPAVQAAWGGRLAAGGSNVWELWNAVAGALIDEGGEQAAMEDFRQCLQVPLPGRYVPPYASMFLDTPATLWGPSTQRVRQWYEQGGLEWRRFQHIVAPDHVGIEWAFLAELSAHYTPETNALRERFVAEHILRWFPAFVTRLEGVARGLYYPALARWGIAWSEAIASAQ